MYDDQIEQCDKVGGADDNLDDVTSDCRDNLSNATSFTLFSLLSTSNNYISGHSSDWCRQRIPVLLFICIIIYYEYCFIVIRSKEMLEEIISIIIFFWILKVICAFFHPNLVVEKIFIWIICSFSYNNKIPKLAIFIFFDWRSFWKFF